MALTLRASAREAMLQGGGRGFMRFADGALLISDAPRRCAHAGALRPIEAALEARGFACAVDAAGLMHITPGDALLQGIAAQATPVDWQSPLHPAQALAARWLREREGEPLTDAGRALAVEALRLTGQPGAKVIRELTALRARAAVMLRTGDRSGLRIAGAILQDWCNHEEETRYEA